MFRFRYKPARSVVWWVESGAGKSMIGKAVLGTLPRAIIATGGEIILDGENLQDLTPTQRRQVIGAKTALIPQDPLTALNPSRRVGAQITQPPR